VHPGRREVGWAVFLLAATFDVVVRVPGRRGRGQFVGFEVNRDYAQRKGIRIACEGREPTSDLEVTVCSIGGESSRRGVAGLEFVKSLRSGFFGCGRCRWG
jgi:hypothetical protein